jgi:hypothetical protein
MTIVYTERSTTMRKPSLAEAVLTAVEELTYDLRHLYEAEPMTDVETFARGIQALANLEAVAQRRVDDATYQSHRRAMEICHIEIPAQVTHG